MPLQNRFNLIDEPWIPVVDVGLVSLRQIFTCHEYRALGGNPIEKIAITKLLLAIEQAAYTPVDDDDWSEKGPEGIAQLCVDYLEKWHDSFWLYGERPFLQMPEISRASIKSFGAVLPEIASGNTTILTETQLEKKLSDSKKAMLIVVQMGFALGGKKTDNSVVLTRDYAGKKNDKGKPSTGKAGPSIGFMGFMHNLLLGESLVETLWLNLLSEENLTMLAMYQNGVGTAPWEQMPQGEDCDTAQKLKKSLMGRLVPLSRFCLLSDEGIHYSEGIAHPGYDQGMVDPSVSVNFSGKKAKILWIDPEKRPWRYLSALLSFISASQDNYFNCTHIKYGVLRVRDRVKSFGIWSGGLKVSSNAGEQYVSGNDDFVESSFSLPTESLGEEWYAKLSQEMTILDGIAKIIYGATISYFKKQSMKGDDQAKIATHLYWQLCEREAQNLINHCVDTTESKNMRRIFVAIAQKVYDTVCQRYTSRQLDAWASCRPNLIKYLN